MALFDFLKPKWERAIRKLNRTNHWQIRENAARTLGELRDERACRELAIVLQERSCIELRVAVAEALGKIGCIEATAPLTATLGDEDGALRKAAADALALLGSTKWKEWVRGDEEDFVRLSNSGDKSAASVLYLAHASALKHREWNTILTAIDGLAKLGDQRAIEPLLNMLQQREKLKDRFRDTIITHFLIATVPREKWGPQNIFSLSEEQDSIIDHKAHSAMLAVCTAAVRALGQLGYPNALAVLSGLEQDMGPELRKTAKHQSSQCGGQIESDAVRCDRCPGRIDRGEGFLLYSAASFGLPNALCETGNMLVCESCADSILNDETFANEFPMKQDLSADVLADMTNLHHIMEQANTASIVDLCKKRGLHPREAKLMAAELARHWWKDSCSAQRDAASFWTSAKQA